MNIRTVLAVLALSQVGNGQETVNGGMVVLGPLRSSGPQGVVDFTAAGATSPVKSGTLAARPGTCVVGQMYFAMDAAAGQNLAFCTSAGTWTMLAGGTLVGTVTPAANAIPQSGAGGTLAAGWMPTLNQSTTGNAATATALATLPTPCSAGNYPLGILTNGNSMGCTPAGAGASVANPYTNINPALAYSANPIPCLKGPISFAQWSGIGSQQAQGTRLFTAAPGWRYWLSRVEPGTGFAGTGVASLAIALGSAGVPVGFMSNFQIFPTLTVPYNEASGGIGLAADGATLDVFGQLTVTSGAGLLSALTAGTVTIMVCGMVP